MKIGLFLLCSFWGSSLSAQFFKNCTEELKISHSTFSPYLMAGGISVIDFNQDGFEDLYFTGGRYADQLFMNIDGTQFENITVQAGLQQLADRYTMGAVAGDLDNDGYPDLFITTHKGERNICLRNINGAYFEDVTESAGIFGTKWSSSATMADPDLDGDLDIYVGNYLDFSEDPFFLNISEMQPNHFFENQGNWNFTGNLTAFEGGEDGCTLVSCFTDIDYDGDPDLFVINDFGGQFTPNELYINQEDEDVFLEQAAVFEVNEAINGMGIAIGDVNNDGYFDYYFSNIGENPFYAGGKNNAFTNITDAYHLNDGLGYSWGTFFGDFNNDTYDDLFVAKGSISEGHDPQPNKLYQFDGSIQNFIDVSVGYGISDEYKARGAAYADLNNDGWLDIIVNNIKVLEENTGQAQVYLNQGFLGNTSDSAFRFMKIQLEGDISNRSAYGTFVELHCHNRKLIREVRGGSSYLSNNSSIIHFGLGDLPVDSLVITWPSSIRQVFTNIEPNTFYYLLEGEEISVRQSKLVTSLNMMPSKQDLQIKIFPNPGDTFITIDANNFKTEDGNIYSMEGQQVMSVAISPGENILDVSTLSPGVYLLRIGYRISKLVIV